MRVKVFIFKKFQGSQILISFCENWHEASFYNKEQMQKYKFEIRLLKDTILDPRKSAFLVLKKTPQNLFFFVFRLRFSFNNNRRTNVLLVSNFENAQKKVIDWQKRHFGCFWRLITFFVHFKKYVSN